MSTPGLNLFVGNRLETLADRLAQLVRSPLSSPLETELVIVQSQGMARWVAMELARRNRICANCTFPFPNAFLKYLGRQLFPDHAESGRFEPGAMAFSIMRILPDHLQRPAFSSLKTYLSDDRTGVKLFQLSQKLADLFDQYMVFRPELILGWERGDQPTDSDRRWQADLWRSVNETGESDHRAGLREMLLERLSNRVPNKDLLPRRVSAFGMSHLPLFHLQVLAALSRHIPVNLFLMNPCREYWGDIVTVHDIRRIRAHYADRETASQDLHLDRGNRLLSSMGALGRDFFGMIGELPAAPLELFEAPNRETLLGTVQADILELVEPAASWALADEDKGRVFRPDDGCSSPCGADGSIAVHACHSPMREIEVLHDAILDLLVQDPLLEPRDILVMIPDIETYAPYVMAVFGAVSDDKLRVPFSIADRSILNEGRTVESFAAVLDLVESRMEASRVLDLLEYPVVRQKFGLTEPDLPRLEEWVQNLNIRWGRDALERSRLGLPGNPENSWAVGIQRLLLGLAIAGEDHHLFAGILPYDDLNDEDRLLLGRFLDFLRALFQTCRTLEKPKTTAQWEASFDEAIKRLFLQAGPFENELQILRDAIGRMAESAALAGFEENLGLAVVKGFLLDSLEKRSFGSGFIAGGVTFCAMLPMRSIPFKVICMVGMNSDAFPRDVRKPSFDAMAGDPRKGDRSRRDDDKYLFLEALISARQTLYISYTGQSVQDNSRVTPSVLVSELVDYIHDRFGLDPESWVQHHPLQAFSRLYFQPQGPFFSYSTENFTAATGRNQGRRPSRFMAQGLEPPPEAWHVVDVETMCQFFNNPTRFLLQKRLGLVFEHLDVPPDDRENFRLQSLDRYLAAQDLFRYQQQGIRLDDLKPVMDARGILPHGQVGACEFRSLRRDIQKFAATVTAYTQGRRPTEQALELAMDEFRLTGTIPGVYGDHCLHFRYARSNPRDMLRLWIYHLVRGSLAGGAAPESWYISGDAVFEFKPAHDGIETLKSLLAVYWQGLSEPIHFFPDSAYTYAEQVVHFERARAAALKKAALRWHSTRTWAESDDPYVSLCFGDMDPLDSRFENLALGIYGPMLTHMRDMSGPYN